MVTPHGIICKINKKKQEAIISEEIKKEQMKNVKFRDILLIKRLNCLLVPNLFRDIYYYIKHIRTGILKAYILIKTFA